MCLQKRKTNRVMLLVLHTPDYKLRATTKTDKPIMTSVKHPLNKTTDTFSTCFNHRVLIFRGKSLINMLYVT